MALLRAPEYPACFAYLFDWFAEFLLWMPPDRAPAWPDWQAWGGLMERAVTPWDIRQLRRIHDAYFAAERPKEGKA